MFHFKTIRWRIASSYLLLIVGVTLGLTLVLTQQVRTRFLEDLQQDLSTEARLLAASRDLHSHWPDDRPGLEALADQWSQLLGVRVTMVATDGRVLADSHQDPAKMDNHQARPEIAQALSAGLGTATRVSKTLGYEMLFVAVPVQNEDDPPIGVLRLALSTDQVSQNANSLRAVSLATGAMAALLAMVLATVIAERTARPIRRLTEVAERLADGNLALRYHPETNDEVARLTRAFNRLVDASEEQVNTLAREQGRLATVLNNLSDGILILDTSGRVQLSNPAAMQLLEIRSPAIGQSFPQVARDHRVVELWSQCRESGAAQNAYLEVSNGRFLQCTVAPFWDGFHQGYLVLLRDLTQVRRLERMRQDFVSNISHELRTPLASLQALVETLRDGALEDPPAARRFLDRIETEVDALTQMVQELLELSRIESGQVPFNFQPTPVGDIVLKPVERLQPQAERAGVSLIIDLPARLPLVSADAGRVRQVITNLVHNAIKFTPTGGSIAVRARVETTSSLPVREPVPVAPIAREHRQSMVVIQVSDTGVGIPARDLPRIFERFYKADRARSGGGTGLGLAIAKHIVHAHGGRIWAESVEGKGSTFYISLPVVNQTFTID
jgi:two-component system phosphate regulon sensor histidine kinase PhoR